jgi:quinol monooxygenase YgiN
VVAGAHIVPTTQHVVSWRRATHRFRGSVAASHPAPRYAKGLSMANVLTIVAKIRAAAGKSDALAALLVEQAAVVRSAEPGCLLYRPHRSAKDPDLFLVYEMYADDAALDAHRKAPHLVAFRERREREGLTEGPVEIEIYRSLTD